MTLPIIISVIAGVIAGYFALPPEIAPMTETFLTVALSILLFLVGIDLGINRHVFKDLTKHGAVMILVPLGTIVGSLLGGMIAGSIFGMPANEGLSIASGFGWYSLSGIILTNLSGAELGTIAFLTNIFRELTAIICIPIVAKYLNHYTAIAPAGATSMDTTLPIVSRVTSPEVAVVSFVNGAFLSFLVPILVPFMFGI